MTATCIEDQDPLPVSADRVIDSYTLSPLQLMNKYETAMNGYVPRNYSGKVTLLWPTESPFERTIDSTRGWRDVAREVDVHAVPGGHLTCITKHVEDWPGF